MTPCLQPHTKQQSYTWAFIYKSWEGEGGAATHGCPL